MRTFRIRELLRKNAPAINFRGDYDHAETYVKGDAVGFGKRTYVAMQATTGQDPAHTEVWAALPFHKTPLKDVQVGSYIWTDTGPVKVVRVTPKELDAEKEVVSMTKGHMYYADGILSHNIKLPQG